MTPDIPRPVLKGKKALVIGVANDSSIAYGCAKAFRELGADVAITYLNDKAKPHVEPLARELEASLFLPLDVAVPGALAAGLAAAERRKWARVGRYLGNAHALSVSLVYPGPHPGTSYCAASKRRLRCCPGSANMRSQSGGCT